MVPMTDINLHFTGDFHAITSAHNLLAAMVDNHLYWGHAPFLDARQISWRRIMDMNDRSLRQIVTGLGSAVNGFAREGSFRLTAPPRSWRCCVWPRICATCNDGWGTSKWTKLRIIRIRSCKGDKPRAP